MAVGPSDESIDTFTAFTSLPRDNAIAWLQVRPLYPTKDIYSFLSSHQANNNEVEKATNAFLDSEGAQLPLKAQTVQWDEANFHADKSGDSQQNQNQTSFNVHPPDTLNPNVFGAPSRPPSRASNRADRSASQQYVESEDDQVNRALAMSLSESQTLPGQETGVTDFHKTTFGPAQRGYYDANQWSMTLPGAHTQEILLNPEPFNRKRRPGTPAFFKPAPDAHRLSALIKILHEIPVAREALLNVDLLASDYGHDSQWWDGESIKQLRVVNVDQGYQGVHNQDLVQETQRLMAFLDGTERAYGSVEGISRLQGRNVDKERIALFLEDWQKATTELSPDVQLRAIFESRGVRRGPDEGENKEQAFFCLPMSLTPDMVDSGLSFYDALDEVIWEDIDGPEVFLRDIGNVVTFNVTCWNTSATRIGIDIPATWYPDRYLESSIKQAREYLERKRSLVNQRDELETRKENFLRFNTYDASSLRAKAMSYLEQTSVYRLKTRESENPGRSVGSASPVELENLLGQLKVLEERIGNKLRTLEQTKERLVELVKENSLFYTRPTNDPETCPMHKYTLRGVATLPSTCYVLEKVKPEADDDLIKLEDLEWQWWKLEYVSSDINPVVTTKVLEEDVLTSARTESRSVLLVYADEYAVNYESTPLPPQLKNFVRADNLSFEAEVNESSQATRESPGKRKALSDDKDDLITEHGRSPPFNRDQFRDQNADDASDSSQPMPWQREQLSAQFSDTSCLDPHHADHLPPPPTSMPSFRTLKPKLVGQGSSDDNIPISLRSTDRAREQFDRFDMSQDGQEMQERSTGTSFLQGRTHVKDGYQLGDYVPEIDMEDDDKEPSQKDWKEGHGQSNGRGGRSDTW